MLHPLSAALQTWQNHPQQQQWQQWQTIQKLWPEIVGSPVSQHTQPLRTQHSTLYVATSSSAWAQNLRLQRRLILAKLNPHLPQPLREIHFSPQHWLPVPEAHPPAPPPPHKPPPPPARSTPPTPQAAFQRWAETLKALTRHYPPCPRCHSPTPPHELHRWGHCYFCHQHTQ
ncbi:MAG: DUF721 domain-containing protein [Thermostichales cyanobacterium HHBFW_bins_127]